MLMKYVTLRIPKELHAEIKDKAWEQKKSMNQFILDCLNNGIIFSDTNQCIKETPTEDQITSRLLDAEMGSIVGVEDE